MTTVTHADLRSIPCGRRVGYCNRGAREFFIRHGLDWHAFKKDGLPAEVFEATGDAMAVRLAEWVRNGRK